jgi:sterol desaturase/sphingolipid hydroxylase (fatty acid hydroxylase superfamily)
MQHITNFLVDVSRLALWLVVLAAVFVPLERVFALRPAKAWRADVVTDIGYYFLSSLLPAALLAFPVALLVAALQRLMPAAWSNWAAQSPDWMRLALTLIAIELGTYWGHRWTHQVPWLWRFHAIHHSAEHIDWLVNTRAHPFDMVFVRFCGLVPVFVLGLAKPSVAGSGSAIAVTLATTFWGFLIHANVRWRFGLLEQLLATPAFHHWHHTRLDHINRNYAAMFPWMDRLFGTLHLPKEWPAAYGSDTRVSNSLLRQLVEPLRPKA